MLKRFKSLIGGGCVVLLSACTTLSPPTPEEVARNKEIPQTVVVPNAVFFTGSSQTARETAYRIDEEAYKSPITREQHWYEYELPIEQVRLRGFFITQTPITNEQYGAFIRETGREFPTVDIVEWQSYGVNQPFEVSRKYAWTAEGYPIGRDQHPVVLVSQEDAKAYARWLSSKTGLYWRLPTEPEWELAARGIDGRSYPWGDNFNPALANTADLGPHDTLPVGSFPRGASPFGVLDMAGQVYEWTTTPGEKGRMTVKGGAWDDRGCGVCRAGARHHRNPAMKHILIGFRLVQVPEEK